MANGENHARNIVEATVANVLKEFGFDTCSSVALDVLTDVTHYYLRDLCITLRNYSEYRGSAYVDVREGVTLLRLSHVDIDELIHFVEHIPPMPLDIPVARFPVAVPSNLNFLKPGSKEVLLRPMHIHEHLPPMFTEEEERQIQVTHPKGKEGTLPLLTVNPVLPGNSNINNSSLVSTSSVVSKSENRDSSQNVQKKDTNGPRFVPRELVSMIMTTSGFISHGKEGRSPDNKASTLPESINDSQQVKSNISNDVQKKKKKKKEVTKGADRDKNTAADLKKEKINNANIDKNIIASIEVGRRTMGELLLKSVQSSMGITVENPSDQDDDSLSSAHCVSEKEKEKEKEKERGKEKENEKEKEKESEKEKWKQRDKGEKENGKKKGNEKEKEKEKEKETLKNDEVPNISFAKCTSPQNEQESEPTVKLTAEPSQEKLSIFKRIQKMRRGKEKRDKRVNERAGSILITTYDRYREKEDSNSGEEEIIQQARRDHEQQIWPKSYSSSEGGDDDDDERREVTKMKLMAENETSLSVDDEIMKLDLEMEDKEEDENKQVKKKRKKKKGKKKKKKGKKKKEKIKRNKEDKKHHRGNRHHVKENEGIDDVNQEGKKKKKHHRHHHKHCSKRGELEQDESANGDSMKKFINKLLTYVEDTDRDADQLSNSNSFQEQQSIASSSPRDLSVESGSHSDIGIKSSPVSVERLSEKFQKQYGSLRNSPFDVEDGSLASSMGSECDNDDDNERERNDIPLEMKNGDQFYTKYGSKIGKNVHVNDKGMGVSSRELSPHVGKPKKKRGRPRKDMGNLPIEGEEEEDKIGAAASKQSEAKVKKKEKKKSPLDALEETMTNELDTSSGEEWTLNSRFSVSKPSTSRFLSKSSKSKRGRPRKHPSSAVKEVNSPSCVSEDKVSLPFNVEAGEQQPLVKRKVGRPRKHPVPTTQQMQQQLETPEPLEASIDVNDELSIEGDTASPLILPNVAAESNTQKRKRGRPKKTEAERAASVNVRRSTDKVMYLPDPYSDDEDEDERPSANNDKDNDFKVRASRKKSKSNAGRGLKKRGRPRKMQTSLAEVARPVKFPISPQGRNVLDEDESEDEIRDEASEIHLSLSEEEEEEMRSNDMKEDDEHFSERLGLSDQEEEKEIIKPHLNPKDNTHSKSFSRYKLPELILPEYAPLPTKPGLIPPFVPHCSLYSQNPKFGEITFPSVPGNDRFFPPPLQKMTSTTPFCNTLREPPVLPKMTEDNVDFSLQNRSLLPPSLMKPIFGTHPVLEPPVSSSSSILNTSYHTDEPTKEQSMQESEHLSKEEKKRLKKERKLRKKEKRGKDKSKSKHKEHKKKKHKHKKKKKEKLKEKYSLYGSFLPPHIGLEENGENEGASKSLTYYSPPPPSLVKKDVLLSTPHVSHSVTNYDSAKSDEDDIPLAKRCKRDVNLVDDGKQGKIRKPSARSGSQNDDSGSDVEQSLPHFVPSDARIKENVFSAMKHQTSPTYSHDYNINSTAFQDSMDTVEKIGHPRKQISLKIKRSVGQYTSSSCVIDYNSDDDLNTTSSAESSIWKIEGNTHNHPKPTRSCHSPSINSKIKYDSEGAGKKQTFIKGNRYVSKKDKHLKKRKLSEIKHHKYQSHFSTHNSDDESLEINSEGIDPRALDMNAGKESVFAPQEEKFLKNVCTSASDFSDSDNEYNGPLPNMVKENQSSVSRTEKCHLKMHIPFKIKPLDECEPCTSPPLIPNSNSEGAMMSSQDEGNLATDNKAKKKRVLKNVKRIKEQPHPSPTAELGGYDNREITSAEFMGELPMKPKTKRKSAPRKRKTSGKRKHPTGKPRKQKESVLLDSVPIETGGRGQRNSKNISYVELDETFDVIDDTVPKPKAKRSISKKSKKSGKRKKSNNRQSREQFHYIDADGNQIWICPTCGLQDDGSPMIGCDGCDAWYHWSCLRISSPPGDREWFCAACKAEGFC